jgi:competence protein ComEC
VTTSRSRPFARILLSFCIGCRSGLEFGYQAVFWVIAILLIAFYCFLVFHKKGWLPYTHRWLVGLTIQLSVFIYAFLLASLQEQRLSITHESFYKSDSLLFEVSEHPVRKQTKYRGMARICMLKGEKNGTNSFSGEVIQHNLRAENQSWHSAQGNVLIYFSEEDSSDIPGEGSLVVCQGPVSRMVSPGFPGQFDFQKYCERNQCHGALYLNRKDWRATGASSGFSLIQTAHRFRQQLISSFRLAGLSDQDLAVVSALVLGDDDAVDPELMRAFSATGTLHVLSVSGMHVGILYMCVAFLIGKIFRKKSQKWLLTSVVLLVVWCYALLTGLSPAVQRSAMMITLVLLGKTFFESADTWNILCASFILLVACDPALIESAGFLLSYAAVAGIIGFYPWLYAQYLPMNPLKDWIWKSTCVALSAQVFTFPLGLYFFHQFPNYFLPANLIIIPLSTIVLFSGIVLLLLLPFYHLAYHFGVLVAYITHLLNTSVRLFGSLPHAQFTGIWITGWECMLIILLVVAAVRFLCIKNNSWLFLSMAILIFTIGMRIVLTWSIQSRCMLFEWPCKSHPMFTVVRGGYAMTFGLSNQEEGIKIYNRFGVPALDALGISEANRITCDSSDISRYHIPILWVNPYLILPDTVYRLTKPQVTHAKERFP